MAKMCDQCGRSSKTGKTRSHSNIATKRKVYLNLQKRVIGGVRMQICTSCLKTLRKKQPATA